jgi:3-oxoacyl-[acyl-carrier protein] reductase
LDRKVALVVGGGSGMGRAGASAMAAEGASVVVADIALDRAQRVAEAIAKSGGTATALHVDVARPELVERLVEDTVARFERIDALYHCAADVHFVNTQDKRLTELDDAV